MRFFCFIQQAAMFYEEGQYQRCKQSVTTSFPPADQIEQIAITLCNFSPICFMLSKGLDLKYFKLLLLHYEYSVRQRPALHD